MKHPLDFAGRIADQVPVLMAYINRAEVYLYANETYSQWFLKAPENVIGVQVRDVIGETFYAIVKPKLDLAIAGEVVSFETQINYPGGPRFVRATYTPDVVPDIGVVLGVHILVQEQGDLASASQNDLIQSVLSHEIRNALSISRLSTELIVRSKGNTDAIARYAGTVITGLDRAERMATNIRDVFRMKAGLPISLSFETVSLHPLLEKVLSDLRIRNWTYGKNHSPEEILVVWDRMAIHRMLELLLGRSRSQLSQSQPEIWIDPVTDTSVEIGIRFPVVDDLRARTYLELATAIAEAHEGKIRSEHDKNSVSTILVILPRICEKL